MAKFSYKAKKGLKDIVEGTIEAQNKEDALDKLFNEGLHPITVYSDVEEKIGTGDGKKRKGLSRFSIILPRKVTAHEVLIFTQKLTILLKAKVELLAALKILHEQSENPFFGGIILQIYNHTREGKSFSNSLNKFSHIFSYLYINIVKSGETSGALDIALEQISEFLSREEAMRKKITVALAYPALLLLVGLSSIFVLMNFVVPRLKPVFAGLGDKLPLLTKIILEMSEVSHKNWWVILVAAAAAVTAMRLPGGREALRETARKIKAKLPVVKRMIKNQELAQFSRSFSLLIHRGVPALEALGVVTPTLGEPHLRKSFKQVYDMVASGKNLSASMENATDLPGFFIKMVAVGEESGRLAEVLGEISHSYNQQVESDIALVSSLLEPLLILFLGLILGTIVLAILIPTFQITQMVS